jgi:hypothetical protein
MYGAEHPETLRAHAARARWLAVGGERPAARRILAELRPRSVQALGATHPDTVAIDAELRHGRRPAARPPAAKPQATGPPLLGVGPGPDRA